MSNFINITARNGNKWYMATDHIVAIRQGDGCTTVITEVDTIYTDEPIDNLIDRLNAMHTPAYCSNLTKQQLAYNIAYDLVDIYDKPLADSVISSITKILSSNESIHKEED